jgi:2-hydroxychromene-2-carboxylate isomerase
MGEVISMAAHRRARIEEPLPEGAGARNRVTFYFDLSSPYTYLAAERVDRMFPHVVWCPTTSDALRWADPAADDLARERQRAAAAHRAAALRLPLVWPENLGPSRAVMRVAALAAERGQGARFVLAASRLAFCGGFELDDPEVIAEASAAALLDFEDCLRAAGDASRDAEMERTGRLLVAQGAESIPAVRVGRSLFCGEARLAEAAAAWRAAPLRVARTAPGA